MRKETYWIELLNDGPEVKLPYEPTFHREGILQQKVGDRWVVGYLATDHGSYSIDDIMGDCMGRLYSFHKSESEETHKAGMAAMKNNPYAQLLDCYSHSGEKWSLHGHGLQCQWDTARGAGVWEPDKCLMEEIMRSPEEHRKEVSRIYCQQFLDQYNAWANGDIYGVVVAWYDAQGELEDSEEVWMHVGYEHARSSMEAMFASYCHSMQLVYDEEVRTACGHQMEIPL